MQIKARLRLTNWIIVALLGVMALALAWTYREAQKADQEEILVLSMQQTSYETVVLRDEYLLRQEDRARAQWHTKTEQLRKLLAQTHARFKDTADQTTIDHMQKKFDLMVFLFLSLEQYRAQQKGTGNQLFPFGEQRLISQIIVNTYDLHADINRLRESAQDTSDDNHKRMLAIVALVMGLAICIILGNSVLINRVLTKRLLALRKGAKIIGSGRFDYRIPITGNDELTDLAKASNDMATQLQASYTSIDNLDRLNERFALAAHAAHLGVWDWDIQKDILVWDDGMYALYGVRKADFHGAYEAWLAGVHPDDRAFCDEVSRQALQGERDYNTEFRILWPDGAVRVLRAYGLVKRDDNGAPLRMTGVNYDITERKGYEQQLEEKNAELERFNYTVSHDLKSPLVTIKSFLGYLEQDIKQQDAERITKDIGYMQTAASKMEQLLNELLELSRVGRLVNAPVQVTFQDLVDEALALVAGRLAEMGVEVRVHEHSLTLFGDRARLVEIWQNLLENAAKFMGDQTLPIIDIGVEASSPDTIFYIRDNGMGIDPKYQQKVFGLFEKLDAKGAGTGLGLALVKRIVELYEGRIWLESQGAGTGACVRFTLPKALKKGK